MVLMGIMIEATISKASKLAASRKPKPKSRYHHGDLRSELLNAAEMELSESGTESFSLRAVAKRAGVSHGAPAHHFKDAKALLTELAIVGYKRFVETQNSRQTVAKEDPESQLIAAGLGYIDFALSNPELFRLMFSSAKPDKSNASLLESSSAAFTKLLANVTEATKAVCGDESEVMKNALASWSMVHGLADLMISDRAVLVMPHGQMAQTERDKYLTEVISLAIRVGAPSQ